MLVDMLKTYVHRHLVAITTSTPTAEKSGRLNVIDYNVNLSMFGPSNVIPPADTTRVTTPRISTTGVLSQKYYFCTSVKEGWYRSAFYLGVAYHHLHRSDGFINVS
ncbi:hypothetical protein FOL47_009182 [Perkinsus chesapeaki]|uniref:Uncharacterized protein n=1 Tax=Perkinsus chesapeaki TaxID=330153 RepID=A0A7J6LA11_PERCH|nr:hypothetical protein FOL47_009182 [Perkinsus chesapeaki]